MMMKGIKGIIASILLVAAFQPATVLVSADTKGESSGGTKGESSGAPKEKSGTGKSTGNKLSKSFELTPSPVEKVTSEFPGYVHVDETHCWEQRMKKALYKSLEDGVAACDADPNCGAVYNRNCNEHSREIYLCPVGFNALPGKKSCIFKKATTDPGSRTETGYAKISNKHCYTQSFDREKFNYETIDDAKKVCDEDPLCGGVYDNDCASIPKEIFLCRSGFTGQASSKSCIYEKEDTKVVVDPKATKAPMPEGVVPAFVYQKEHNVHCFSSKIDDQIFSTNNEAMLACDLMPECLGVYDQNCDETPVDIYLCKIGSKFEGSSTGSCVFGKGVMRDTTAKDPEKEDTSVIVKGYKKRDQTHCFENKYGLFSSMNEARAACNSDSNCKAVYDQGCDESENDIFLCAKGYEAQASSTSCTWRKQDSESEAGAEAPTSAPTVETRVDVADYQKIENVHCRNTKLAEKFDSVEAAIKACSANEKCIGVYDNHCNESPQDVYLCAMGGKYDASGTGSCVFNKTVFEYEYAKIDNKHCYNHKHAEKFDTIASAKAACDKESKCMGIYDQNCDESEQDIFMCESGHGLEASSESCVFQKGEKDVARGSAVWVTEPSMHCFAAKYPEDGYATMHEAKKACLKDTNCYGVYDQECDAESGDIFLCPIGVVPTKSHSGSCVVRKDTNAGYTAAPTTPVETRKPSVEPEDEGDYAYSYEKRDLLHCFNNRVSDTGGLVAKDSTMLTFDNLRDAKKACDAQPNCSAVYDQNCDESNQDIFLCHADGVPSNSGASCIYERSEDKTDVNATVWETHVNRHCYDSAMKDGYDTLAEAKKACDKDRHCYGIYDRQCDMTKGQIFLCPIGAEMKESITGSCVIEKISPDDTWLQLPKTQCATEKYSKYKTMEDAKKACMADSLCSYVYDNNCDQKKGDIYLCPIGAAIKESSTSCTYAKPRGSRTPFPTMRPTHYHTVNKYDRENHYHCFQRKYGLYDTIVEAQRACDMDEDCEAVYDQSCDETERDIFLCPKGYLKEKSATSCVYTKKGDTVVTRAPTPAPVGLKKCQGLDKKTCNLKENKAECEWVYMSFCQNINNPWRPKSCSELPTQKSCPKVDTEESKNCTWDPKSLSCKAPSKSIKPGTKCKKAAKNETQCIALKGCKWQQKKNGVTKCKGIVKK